jgi:hypothetical protein
MAVTVLLAIGLASAQIVGPPMGGPSGQFLGPPDGRVSDFLGSWLLSYEGPIDSHCPCEGTLDISKNDFGELHGMWKPRKGPAITLSGPVGYNQNVWIGRFEQSGDADFPLRGHFRIEARGGGLLTGSYQPEGTAIPYTWRGQR